MPESTYDNFFKKLEEEGLLADEITSLGWAFWLPNGGGFMDERLLRILADEIERRNKPFWDEYEAYCASQPKDTDMEEFEVVRTS